MTVFSATSPAAAEFDPFGRPDRLRHTAIRASAGSGKTYQLTNRYLQLAASGANPASMLASTFTRLAAGQIRDRILTRLADAVDQESKREDLKRDLQLSASATVSRQQIIALLARLSRRMHLMQIRTLDSFFAAVVKAFAIELELPPDAEVVDEEQAAVMRDEAIGLMLDEHDPQKLIDLLRLLTQGASDRSVTTTIDKVVATLYELWTETDPHAWECVPELPGCLPRPALVSAIQRLEEAACPEGKRWMSAFAKDCENARGWQWKDFLASGLAKAIATNQVEGATYGGQPIPPELISAYRPVVLHAKAELISRVREQTIATRDLLAAFHVQFERVKRRRRAITFSDLTRAMVNAHRLGTLDDIAFRLDARLHHLLLDEFQDTSILQWRALEPLIREVVSVAPPERSFFCVGDVKQSIYGWRDAAPEVLDELPDFFRGADGESPIVEEHLSRSYRSSPVIMDVVNTVFESLGENKGVAKFEQAVEAFSRGFDHHETAHTGLPGYAELRFCPAADKEAGEKADHMRLRAAAKLASDLHQRNPNMSIALLTRTNDTVARLLYELGPTKLNVQASGRGGGPITDAAPVNVVLDLLQLADHPDDTIAAFNIATSPAADVVRLPRWDDEPQRRHVARRIRERLLDHGYARTIAEWVKELAPACDRRELRRLRELLDLAHAFDASASARPRDFIRVVEHTKISDAQPARVQVMTIHQSKGLEFDAVILADLDRLLGSGTPSVVVEREGEIGPITRVCRHMNAQTLAFVSELDPLFERHTQRVVRESLSTLYVAMTRAVHGLYMICNPLEINKNGQVSTRGLTSMSGVVRCALAPDATDPDTVHYTCGDPDWPTKIESTPGEAESLTPIERISLARDDHRATLLRGRRVTAASSVGDLSSLRLHLRVPDHEARDRGTALHAMFEQIEWIEDFQPMPETLLAIARAKAPRRGPAWGQAQVKAFLDALGLPEVQHTLSRGHSDPAALQLHREVPFARYIEGREGGIQMGYIDRLVVHLNPDGSPCAAVVIDFKTDQLTSEDAPSNAEHYRGQMESYRQAAAEMLGLDVTSIAMRLLFVVPGVAVDLHGPR